MAQGDQGIEPGPAREGIFIAGLGSLARAACAQAIMNLGCTIQSVTPGWTFCGLDTN